MGGKIPSRVRGISGQTFLETWNGKFKSSTCSGFPIFLSFPSRLSMAPHDRVGEAAYGPLKHKIRESLFFPFYPNSISQKILAKGASKKKEKKFCFDSDLPSNLAPFSLRVENNHFSLLLSLKMAQREAYFQFALPCVPFIFSSWKRGRRTLLRHAMAEYTQLRTPFFPPVFSFDYLCVRSESEK